MALVPGFHVHARVRALTWPPLRPVVKGVPPKSCLEAAVLRDTPFSTTVRLLSFTDHVLVTALS